MRPALLTPMRLLFGIAVFTILCMFAVAAITDHLADSYLSHSTFATSSRVHLVNDVTQALKRAQECRQAYLQTGDSSYLNAYRVACTDVDFSMDRLVSEDHEVTSKLAHAENLREFVHAKLSEIAKTLETKSGAKVTAFVPAADTDLTRIQKLLESLAQAESRDISYELEAARARSVFHRDLVVALAVINILFLAGIAFCATQINKLHSLITMCAWSKRVQYQDKWVPLEEYMNKRFGLRISHGISREEYEKWAASELADELTPTPPVPTPAHTSVPKAAA